MQGVVKKKATSHALVAKPHAQMQSHDELMAVVRHRIVPPLDPRRRKGQAGKVAVVGGCSEYTGAPFYTAIAALKVGADLSHVFCTRGAAPVIKSYSPELIVHPYLQEQVDGDGQACQDVIPWLGRMSCVVIGPGLGRDPGMQSAAERLMHEACNLGVPLVVDADGLAVWARPAFDPDPFKAPGAPPVVITPNANEARRLVQAILGEKEEAGGRSGVGVGGGTEEDLLADLSSALGKVFVVRKGIHDEIFQSGRRVAACTAEGSPRRCGGQGDVLSGAIATFLAWVDAADGSGDVPGGLAGAAAYAGCCLTRAASKRAFAKHGRAMVGSDLIEHVGPAFAELFEADSKDTAGL